MESRKRPQEFPDTQNESDKRLRPGKFIQYNIFPTTQSLFDYVKYIYIIEDIINPTESSKSCTRLLLTKSEFACIIGRGGHNVTRIRNSCGAFIQGCDIDDQNRIVSKTIVTTVYRKQIN